MFDASITPANVQTPTNPLMPCYLIKSWNTALRLTLNVIGLQ